MPEPFAKADRALGGEAVDHNFSNDFMRIEFLAPIGQVVSSPRQERRLRPKTSAGPYKPRGLVAPLTIWVLFRVNGQVKAVAL